MVVTVHGRENEPLGKMTDHITVTQEPDFTPETYLHCYGLIKTLSSRILKIAMMLILIICPAPQLNADVSIHAQESRQTSEEDTMQ